MCTMHTHSLAQKHMCIHIKILVYTVTHVCEWIHVCIHSYTCVLTLPCTCENTHMHTCSHTHTQCMHAYPNVQMVIHMTTCTLTHVCASAHIHSHTIIPACTYSPGPLCILIVHRTFTHMYAHSHKHTSMYILPLSYPHACIHGYILTDAPIYTCMHTFLQCTHVHVHTHHSEFRWRGIMGELPLPPESWQNTLEHAGKAGPAVGNKVAGKGGGWVGVHKGKHLPGVGAHIHMPGQLSLGT